MKIVCIGNRSWAINIYQKLKKETDHKFLTIKNKEKFNKKKIINFNPDYILFYGWSIKVENYITQNYKCLMLHPAPLPRYRGGSPIQNQIINGEKKSAVTIFRMTDNLDAGDIYGQEKILLEGSLEDIFDRITNVGYKLTKRIFKKNVKPVKQDNSKATYFKRRTPNQSEITLSDLKNEDSIYLYNKIRMLSDPYPNAFFATKDKKKLFFKEVSLGSIKKNR